VDICRRLRFGNDADYPDGKEATKAQLRRIARQWSGSRAVDLIGLLAVVLALAGLAGVIAFLVADPKKPVVEGFIGFQQWLVGAGAVALYGYTLSAFRNQATRTRIQALWDVGTFWPNAAKLRDLWCQRGSGAARETLPKSGNRKLFMITEDYYRDHGSNLP